MNGGCNILNAGYIPDGILEDILSRLPSKSLLRFKTVCKSWYSLISSPDFINLHFNRSSQNLKFLCTTSSLQFQLLDFEPSSFNESCLSSPHSFPRETPNDNPRIINILGSSCGLVCVAIGHRINLGANCFGHDCANAGHCGSGLFLWNPFTRELRNIPDLKPSVIDKDRGTTYAHGLGYDPDSDYGVANYAHGLGYDPVSNDLKLVVSKNGLKYDVFSMKSNSWKSIPRPPTYGFIGKFLATVLQGVFHWLNGPYRGCLVVIAFVSFENKVLNVPVLKVASSPFLDLIACLLEHKGCLCISFYLPFPQNCMEIWMLKEQGWIRLFSICLTCASFLPKCISWSGTLVILHNENYSLRFTKDGKFERIHSLYPSSMIYRAAMCVETLISPDDIIYAAWKRTSGSG